MNDSTKQKWTQVLQELKKEKKTLVPILHKAILESVKDGFVTLSFPKSPPFYFDTISNDKNKLLVQKIVQNIFGEGYRIEFCTGTGEGNLKEKKISTLREFTEFIEFILSKTSGTVWYRGCGKSSYKLIPTLYRHPKVTNVEELLKLEMKIIDRFKQRSVPYINRPLTSDWEYLFFMQHFGIPTRLLDWTENPYIALYFALTSATIINGHEQDHSDCLEDAAVWVLDPISWNQKMLKHIHFKGGILSPPLDEELSKYVPSSNIDLMNSGSVAIYGTHNSSRIVAQRGVFVIFGKDSKSMEDVYDEFKSNQNCLIKLVFPQNRIFELLKLRWTPLSRPLFIKIKT